MTIDINNCNKMWGVTQDANGEMLYRVEMYMCIEDPYNIYKSTYLKTSLPSSINNLSMTTVNVNSSTNNTISTPTLTENQSNTLENTSIYDNSSQNTTNISPFSKNKTNINIKNNTFNENNTNHENSTILENNVTSVNLRSTSSKTSPLTTSPSNIKDNTLHTVLIICGIIFIHMVLVGVVYYIKRKRKKQKDKDNKRRNQKKASNHFIRKPQLKPFANEVHPDPNQHRNLQSHPHHQQQQHNPHITNVTNQTFYNTRKKHPPSVNTQQHPHKKQLNLNHQALTPNTKQILDESTRSVKKWYKKTFPAELRQSSSDAPLPPSNIKTLKPNLPNDNGNGTVKLMVHQKEREIQQNNPQHPSFFAQ